MFRNLSLNVLSCKSENKCKIVFLKENPRKCLTGNDGISNLGITKKLLCLRNVENHRSICFVFYEVVKEKI